MNKLEQTTATYSVLSMVAKQTLAKIMNTISDPRHRNAFSTARYLHGLVDEDRLAFTLHHRCFHLVSTYYIPTNTVVLVTYEIIDGEYTHEKKKVRLEHADFVLDNKGMNENCTKENIGNEYVKVLLDAFMIKVISILRLSCK